MNRRLSSHVMMILAVLAISSTANTEAQAGTITTRELRGTCGAVNAGEPDVPTNMVKTFTQLCSMDILFTVMNNATDPVTRHDFTEVVRNFTVNEWFDYHMQLGFGTGTQFTPAAANCGVGFTNTPQPAASPTSFTTEGVGSNRIDWTGRLRRNNEVTFTFSVNVQNLSACIPVGSQLPNGFEFTLRQTPTIPEPATMLLLGTGLAAVAMKMRKRFRK